MTHSRRLRLAPFEPPSPLFASEEREPPDRPLKLVRGLTPLAHGNQWPASDLEKIALVSTLIGGGFDQAVDRLVVCIHAAHFLALARHFVHRVDLQETCTLLAIEVGASFLPVPAVVARSWGVPFADLFERAMHNLVRISMARWSTLSVPPTHEFAFDLLQGDYHAPSHILRKDPGLPRTGRHGNLIGLPASGILISYPIQAALDGQALGSLLAINSAIGNDCHGAISPHLYWRTPDSTFQVQRTKREGKATRFMPSPEFVEQMVRLQKARPGTARA